MRWRLPDIGITDPPEHSATEVLVVNPSATTRKSALPTVPTNTPFLFPYSARMPKAFVQSIRVIAATAMYDGLPAYNGKDLSAFVITLAQPDSTILVKQMPVLCLAANAALSEAQNFVWRPEKWFPQGTLIDPRQSFVEALMPVPSGYVVPLLITYW